jgi:preprotein translocase subunit SecF
MAIEEVEVVIDAQGRVQIEVHGVKGMQCLDLTKDLEQALGGEVESREMTAEAYATVQEETEVQDHQRLRDG